MLKFKKQKELNQSVKYFSTYSYKRRRDFPVIQTAKMYT